MFFRRLAGEPEKFVRPSPMISLMPSRSGRRRKGGFFARNLKRKSSGR